MPYVRNIVLLVVVLTAFSGLAMADYFLRQEVKGRTRRELKEQGVTLNADAAVRAAVNSDLDLLVALESVGVDLGAAGGSAETPLLAAVKGGDARVVDFLLGKQSVIWTMGFHSGDSGQTALGWALKGREFSMAEKLLESGAVMKNFKQDGLPLMLAAVKNDDVELFDFLINHGVAVDGQDEAGNTALATALNGKKSEWVSRLLEAGADANQRGNSGEALLVEAVQSGQKSLLKTLIDHGAVVDVKSKSGESPLMMVVEKKDRVVINLLLEAGAASDVLDAKGHSITDRLIAEGDASMVEFFAFKTDGGITDAWMVKVFDAGKTELLKKLLNKGGNVEARVEKGGRLLKRAVLKKDEGSVDMLLSFGADAEGEVWDALAGGSQVILEKLLESGADANEALVAGVGSPLSLALRQQRYDSAETLLVHGADPNPRQVDGRSLIEEAQRRGDERAVSLLQDYCADYQEEMYSEEMKEENESAR